MLVFAAAGSQDNHARVALTGQRWPLPLRGGTTQSVHLTGHRWEEQKKSLNIETFRGKYLGLNQRYKSANVFSADRDAKGADRLIGHKSHVPRKGRNGY